MDSKYLKIVIIVFLFAPNVLFSQTELSFTPKPDKEYFKSYFLDTRDIAVSPLKWDKKEWIIAGGTVGLTGFLYFNDKEVQGYFQRNRTPFVDKTVKYGIENWGDGTYSLPLLGLMYAYGLISENNRSKKTALLGTKAFIISGCIAQLVKFSTHRHRPYENSPADPYIWDGPSIKHKNLSFLSGHSATAFSIATIIASEYKDRKFIPIIAYSVAGLTALSRVYSNKHWASDVLFGSVVGYAIGKLIFNHNNWGIKLEPIMSSYFNGISISIPISEN
ncbi:phosphatase PAP2 family protein [Bacteroidota bacterium]